MSDIFVSYAREDQSIAERLVERLRPNDWSIWWDPRLRAGEPYQPAIGQELESARCVIVLWSRHSARSTWVQREASEGLRRNVLVPVVIEEGVEPPFGFRDLHTLHVAGWDRADGPAGLKALFDAVARITGSQALERPSERSGSAPSHEQIDQYRLIEKIDEGGMGEVWLAEQGQSIRRRVALKVIKRGMDTDQVLARFETERQALALMNHPCVAMVFDAGTTPRGRPYFVMEFVPGIPITDYCERHQLSTRQRLELFIKVCDGVHHAHQKLIIHRDIKPSNVLVMRKDGQPMPKIIDFGLAKAMTQRLTERPTETRSGELTGTPAYMSPEQFEWTGVSQDIDTRSDVYSLGALLYEILVGEPLWDAKALAGNGLHELRSKIREQEPQRPSARVKLAATSTPTRATRRNVEPATLARELRGDLDWITLKALEQDRERRYSSASALAADISNHLENLPVLAGAPGTAYRIRKFVRRHAVGVTVTSGLLAGLVLGLAGMLSGWKQAKIESTKARQIAVFTQGILSSTTPDIARDFDTKLLRIILDQSSKRIETELSGQPAVEADLRYTIGATYLAVGADDQAKIHLERTLVLRRQLLGEDHPDTLTAMDKLGGLAMAQGKYAEAESVFKDVLERRRRTLGPDHADVGASLNNLGVALAYLRDNDRSRTTLEEALAIRKKALDPDDPDLAVTMKNLADRYAEGGEFGRAREYHELALEIRKRHYGPESLPVAYSLTGVATMYEKLGDLEKARVAAQRSVEIRERFLPKDHPKLVRGLYFVARIMTKQGQDEAARPILERILGSWEKTLGPMHEDVGVCTLDLAGVLLRVGSYEEAASRYGRALEIIEAGNKPDPCEIVTAMTGRAQALRRLGRRGEAETIERRAHELDGACTK